VSNINRYINQGLNTLSSLIFTELVTYALRNGNYSAVIENEIKIKT